MCCLRLVWYGFVKCEVVKENNVFGLIFNWGCVFNWIEVKCVVFLVVVGVFNLFEFVGFGINL